jgi:hypothetical protein
MTDPIAHDKRVQHEEHHANAADKACSLHIDPVASLQCSIGSEPNPERFTVIEQTDVVAEEQKQEEQSIDLPLFASRPVPDRTESAKW